MHDAVTPTPPTASVDNGEPSPPRLLVVVAHPDDETFGCGSLLLHAAEAGARTSVVCATRGEAGRSAPGSGVEPGRLGAVREAELREAARELGVDRVEVLGLVDSGMGGEPSTDTLAGAPFDAVRDSVAMVVDRLLPDVVVTLDAGDGHRDHVRIRDATIAAVGAATWRVPRVYLQCLSQSLMREWLEHVAREHPESEHLLGEVPGTPDADITTVIDTRHLLARRERAMAVHRSQVSPYDGLPSELRDRFLTTDRLRRVVPPWTGGSLEDDVFDLSTARP